MPLVIALVLAVSHPDERTNNSGIYKGRSAQPGYYLIAAQQETMLYHIAHRDAFKL